MRKLLLPLLLVHTGCNQLLDKDFLEGMTPSVSFSGLNVGYVDFESIETDFVFNVNNPNPVGEGVDC